jgi:hypothetical protein
LDFILSQFSQIYFSVLTIKNIFYIVLPPSPRSLHLWTAKGNKNWKFILIPVTSVLHPTHLTFHS